MLKITIFRWVQFAVYTALIYAMGFYFGSHHAINKLGL